MNPYEVLGVSPNATKEEIKTAYRELVKKYHPDRYTDEVMKAKATEKIKEINEAYDILIKGKNAGTSAHSNGSRGYSGAYSGQYSAEFANAEQLINMGRFDEAEAVLYAIPLRNARWNYLSGVLALRRGRYNTATRYFEEAYRQEPNNPEYRNAYNSTHMDAETYSRTYTRSSGYEGCCQALLCSYCLSVSCNGCIRGCC